MANQKKYFTFASKTLVIMVSATVFVQDVAAKERIRYHINGVDRSPLREVDEQGIPVAIYRYSPFGEQLQSKKTVTIASQRGFVGGVNDQQDLVYLKNRYYNSTLGRFYQPDPVTFLEAGLGQVNRYQYGRNDTYSYIDSDGKIVWFPIIAWAVLGGTVGGAADAGIQYIANDKVNWKQTALATGFGALGGPLGAEVNGWRSAAALGFALGGTNNIATQMIAKNRSFNEIDRGELLFSSTFGMAMGGAQSLVPKAKPIYWYKSDPSAMHANNLMSQVNGYYTFTYPFFYGILPTIGSSTISSAAGEGYDRRAQFIQPSEKFSQFKPK